MFSWNFGSMSSKWITASKCTPVIRGLSTLCLPLIQVPKEHPGRHSFRSPAQRSKASPWAMSVWLRFRMMCLCAEKSVRLRSDAGKNDLAPTAPGLSEN